MLSCLTCVPVVDQKDVVETSAVNTQGTKKNVLMSSGGATVIQECETKGEGKVKFKTGNTLYTWKMIRISVEDTHILVYEKKNSAPTKVLPLHLCNVRPVSRRRFRVLCAPNIQLEFRASDNAALREWVNVIQSGIVRRLSAQTENTKSTASKSSGMDLLEALRKAHKSNKYCADCNAPDPKWISVSIGCIICIECSGVHRQLGSTISKVRSFELDMWTNRTEMIEKIGNADVNSIYEANLLPGYNKPHAFSDREEREKYIYNKYVHKMFRKKPLSRNISGGARNKSSALLSCSDTLVQNRKRSSISITGSLDNVPRHKRNASQKPTVHIGSDLFAVQGSIKPDFAARRGSLAMLDPIRRGSLNSTLIKNKRTALLDQRRHSVVSHSLRPTLASTQL